MKLLVTLLFALLIFSGFVLTAPVSSFAAASNNNNYNNNDNHNNNKDKEDKDKKDRDDKDEKEDKVTVCHNNHTITISKSALRAHLAHGDTREACIPVNVPEFGLIPGVIAAISSTGTFYYLKKKKFN